MRPFTPQLTVSSVLSYLNRFLKWISFNHLYFFQFTIIYINCFLSLPLLQFVDAAASCFSLYLNYLGISSGLRYHVFRLNFFISPQSTSSLAYDIPTHHPSTPCFPHAVDPHLYILIRRFIVSSAHCYSAECPQFTVNPNLDFLSFLLPEPGLLSSVLTQLSRVSPTYHVASVKRLLS